ncbi:unnamed protein product [Cuscuta europaea]|uniref:Uncharacterized protein n=1 Tax=Cuscuta europaea TaxID=41803 RepID=A0A9P1DWX7_CUSEU|nr:unnamed protein product [Cuscuta europaea]
MDSAGISFGRVKQLRAQPGPANRADRALSQPHIGAFDVETVVAAGNEPSRLVDADGVQTNRAVVAQNQILTGDAGKLLELRGGEADGLVVLHRLRVVRGGGGGGRVGGGVPE